MTNYSFSNVKDWFMNKNFTDSERYAIKTSDSETILKKETEKAVLLRISTRYGFIEKWVPKQNFYTAEEIKASYERQNAAFEKYENLIAWAKENGAKVRKGMKKITVLSKIAEAGLTVPAQFA